MFASPALLVLCEFDKREHFDFTGLRQIRWKQNGKHKPQGQLSLYFVFYLSRIFPLGTVAFQENILELATFLFALNQLLLVSKK